MHHICVFATHNSCLQRIRNPKMKILGVQITDVYVSGMSQNHSFGHEMGRRGSPQAHTLGKRSYGPQDHFKIGFGAQNIKIALEI